MSGLMQFNVQYVMTEDRLRLRMRMGDQEFILWLTRRYTKLLLTVLDKIAMGEQEQTVTDGSPQAKQAVKHFKRDAALQSADFKTAYKEAPAEHPLGDEPVLVSKLGFNVGANGVVTLNLGTPDGRGIKANINQEMVFALSSMLGQAARSAGWDLVLPGMDNSTMAAGQGQPLHH